MKTLIAVILILVPSVALAQETPANYLYVRGGSSSPFMANFSRTFDGDKLVWFGTLQDPNMDPIYREYQVGLGKALGASQVYSLALYASDGWYLQIVGIPTANWKKLTFSSFTAVYVPLEEAGIKQFLIDPATALVKVSDKWAVGASYTLYAASGFRKDAVGPTLQFSVPKGTINVDLFEGLTNYKREVRVTLQLAF